jgi:exodeoxyribonuclease V alpha subunit
MTDQSAVVSTPPLSTYLVTVLRIVFRSPEYVVLTLRHCHPIQGEPEEFVAVGEMMAVVETGAYLQVVGRWEETVKFGRRYRILATETALPHTLAGIRALLGSGLIVGLGPGLASRIVDRFGTDTLQVIGNAPERLLEVEGIGPAAVDSVMSFWRNRSAVVHQLATLCGFGLSSSQAARVIAQFGQESVTVIQAQPYRLMEVSRVGFGRADQVAKLVGVAPASAARVTAAIIHVMEEAATGGHSCCPGDRVVRQAASLLGVDPCVVTAQMQRLQQDQQLYEDHGMWYLPRLWQAEAMVESSVSQLIRAPVLETFSTSPRIESMFLTTTQDLAVKRALSYPLSVLVGATGTGKTVVVGAVVRLARRLGLTVLLCAPTGKAAIRLTELTGQPAMSVQRALEFVPGHGCRRHKDRPWDVDLVVMDDASLLDVQLAADFFQAVDPDRTGVLMAGDDAQLPAIGPGQVLRDFVRSGVCLVTRLEEVHRQAAQSSIVRLAHQIHMGRLPALAQDWGENHTWCFGTEVSEIQTQLLTVLQELENEGSVAKADCQVLVPFRRGPLGTEALNRLLQNFMAPLPRPALGQFRLGDRVLHIVDDLPREVFNGDIGRVTEINEREGYLLVTFGQRVIPFLSSQLFRLELAYCLPVHRAQGSEFPCVVVVFHSSHYADLRAELLYSAVTRAKDRLVLLGVPQAYQMAVKNHLARERHSGLFRRAMTCWWRSIRGSESTA